MAKPNAREKVVEAALEQFHRAGYHGSSVDDIVRAAGVPKGSFYNHFKSKEDLAVVVIDRYVEMGPLECLLAKEISPLKRLKNHFGILAKIFENAGHKKGCMLGNFSAELADHSGVVHEKLSFMFSAWVDLIASVIKEGQSSKEIESKLKAERLAGFLLSAWEGTLLRARATNDVSLLKEFNQIAFDQLLK